MRVVMGPKAANSLLAKFYFQQFTGVILAVIGSIIVDMVDENEKQRRESPVISPKF